MHRISVEIVNEFLCRLNSSPFRTHIEIAIISNYIIYYDK